MSELLLIDRSHSHVANLTMNRPDRRNALGIDLMEALRAAIEKVSTEPGKRALVIHGIGPAFCSGLDFKEAQDPANAHRSASALAALYKAICTCPLITIAAAHGAAFGGGAGLIAACDFAVAAENLQLGYPEVRRGLVAALVSCLIRRQVAGPKLREILFFGKTFSAHEAMAAGLVTKVVPPAVLGMEATALAASLSASAPGAIARTKLLLYKLDRIEEDLQIALDFHLTARNADEAAEGMAAFFEKREPKWATDNYYGR